MSLIARIRDWLLERRIRTAVRAFVIAPPEYRPAAFERLRTLSRRRSPDQVARMERRMGIGGGVS